MKNFIAIGLLVIAVALLVAAIIADYPEILGGRYPEPEGRSSYHVPALPQTWNNTYSLLPGGSMSVRNRDFRKVQVRSDFPIRASVGVCRSEYTVELDCDGDPDAILVTDVRRMPIFSSAQSNTISIKASTF
jgi:hypothetical protein